MNISRSATFTLNGYPISSLRNERGDFGIFDGEGVFYYFDRNGAQLGLQRLSKIGFSDATDFGEFSILTGLDGKFYYSDFNVPLTDILSKVRHPCHWNGKLFFVNNERLYHWSFKKDFPVLVKDFHQVETIWPCGESLLVMTKTAWFVLMKDGKFELLTSDILPFTSCTYLPKNNTFHFILPRGEMAFVNLNTRLNEPYMTQATGNGLKILGTTSDDKVALSYFNQLIFMKAESSRFDEYSTVTVENLHSEPISVKAHPSRSLFLVQEDKSTAAIWEADSSQCLWRSSFEAELCYMSFRGSDFLLGFQNGFMGSFTF